MNTTLNDSDDSVADPPWAMIANVVSQRPCKDPSTGVLDWRAGTKHFSPGTKVICGRVIEWFDADTKISVLGRARKSKRWILLFIRLSSLDNFRVKQIHNANLLNRLLETKNKHYFVNVVKCGEEHREYLKQTCQHYVELTAEAHRLWGEPPRFEASPDTKEDPR